MRKTINSYLSTISVQHELIIIDNASTDGSPDFIRDTYEKVPESCSSILLQNPIGGGEAINLGLEKCHGAFLHVSENDMEYRPGWDQELLRKMESFPEVGQLSLLGTTPEYEIGEIGSPRPATPITKHGETIHIAEKNVTATSIFRRELWDKGVRWRTKHNAENNKFRFPAANIFSEDVRKHGYTVAWNDKYLVIDWGRNISEWINNTDYYIENYRSKKKLEVFKARLDKQGFNLVVGSSGKYQIIKKR